MSDATLIANARIIDPASNHDAIGNLLIQGQNITDFGADVTAPDGAARIDATGLILCPGLVDIRASFGKKKNKKKQEEEKRRRKERK